MKEEELKKLVTGGSGRCVRGPGREDCDGEDGRSIERWRDDSAREPNARRRKEQEEDDAVCSPGVFTPLLFDCTPEFGMNNSTFRGPPEHMIQKPYFTRVKKMRSRAQCRDVLHE